MYKIDFLEIVKNIPLKILVLIQSRKFWATAIGCITSWQGYLTAVADGGDPVESLGKALTAIAVIVAAYVGSTAYEDSNTSSG